MAPPLIQLSHIGINPRQVINIMNIADGRIMSQSYIHLRTLMSLV